MNSESNFNKNLNDKLEHHIIDTHAADLPLPNVNPFPISSNYTNYNIYLSRKLNNEVKINFDYQFSGITGTGFVAYYASEGPDRLVWSQTGQTYVTVPIVNENGITSVIILRLSKITSSGRFSMNSCIEIQGEIPGGQYDLGFSFYTHENIQIPAGSYRGVLPLYIESWFVQYKVPVRINIFLD